MSYWPEWFAGGIIVAIVLLAGFGIYDEMHAEKFSLRKDRWVCTRSHEEMYTTFIYAGNNTQIPVTNFQTVCDQWSHK